MEYLPVLMSIAVVLLGAASPEPTFVMVSSYAIGGSPPARFVSRVVSRFPEIYTAVQLAGSAYLIWVDIKMLLSAERAQGPKAKTAEIFTIDRPLLARSLVTERWTIVFGAANQREQQNGRSDREDIERAWRASRGC